MSCKRETFKGTASRDFPDVFPMQGFASIPSSNNYTKGGLSWRGGNISVDLSLFVLLYNTNLNLMIKQKLKQI